METGGGKESRAPRTDSLQVLDYPIPPLPLPFHTCRTAHRNGKGQRSRGGSHELSADSIGVASVDAVEVSEKYEDASGVARPSGYWETS